MKVEKEISLLRSKLTKAYEKRRRENYLKNAHRRMTAGD